MNPKINWKPAFTFLVAIAMLVGFASTAGAQLSAPPQPGTPTLNPPSYVNTCNANPCSTPLQGLMKIDTCYILPIHGPTLQCDLVDAYYNSCYGNCVEIGYVLPF